MVLVHMYTFYYCCCLFFTLETKYRQALRVMKFYDKSSKVPIERKMDQLSVMSNRYSSNNNPTVIKLNNSIHFTHTQFENLLKVNILNMEPQQCVL